MLNWIRSKLARLPTITQFTTLNGFGSVMGRPRRFTQDEALRHLSGWVYAAAMLNANAAASVPLRLFVRKRSAKSLQHETRKLSRKSLDYFSGRNGQTPSRSVMAKVAEYGEGFEEVVEQHPAIKLLSTANRWQDGYELSVLRFLYLEMTGNAYLHPVNGRLTGTPVELWPLPPQHVRIVPGENVVQEYIYEPTQHRFDADEVIMFRRPNPIDPLGYGLGKAEALWSALGLSSSKRRMDRSKFDNNCRPDWLLVAKSGATKDSLDRLEAAVEGRLMGRNSAGRFLTVTGDVDAKALNFDSPDVGDPDKLIQEIAAGFGVPLYKLVGNDPVKANSGVQDVGWLRDTILPMLRLDEETLNSRYLKLWDLQDDAFLAYDDPVPANRIEQTARLKDEVAGVIRMPNEARAELGLEPVEGGDVLLVGSGMVPLAMAGQQQNPLAGLFNVSPGGGSSSSPLPPPATDEPNAGGAAQEIQTREENVLNGAQVQAAIDIVAQVTAGTLPRDAGVSMLQTFFNLAPDVAEAVMGSAGKPVPTTPNPNPAQEANNGTEEAPAQVPAEDQNQAGEMVDGEVSARAAGDLHVHGKSLARPLPQGEELAGILRKYFYEQREAVLGAVGLKATKDKDKLPSGFIPLSEWDEKIARAAQPVIELILRQQGQQLLQQIGASPDVFAVFNQNIPEAAKALSLKFAQSTNQTTSMQLDAALDALRQEIADGLIEGDSRIELRQRVQKIFDSATNERADMIARTEASRATHQAEQIAATKSGLKTSKEWVLSADACPICQAIADATAGGIDASKTFAELGGEYGSIEAPPAHVNCLVGETPVIAPHRVKAFSAEFEGPVVRIVVRGGRTITATPNHMFLTAKGFIRAASLRKGDEVIDYINAESLPLGDPHDDGNPAAIQDIVASLAKSTGMSSGSVPVSPEYLHGDAIRVQGDINVVSPDGFLRGEVDPAFAQPSCKSDFAGANVPGVGLNKGSDLASMLFALRSATDCGVGRRREATAFSRRECAHPDLLRFSASAQGNTRFLETPFQGRSAQAGVARESLEGHARSVEGTRRSQIETESLIKAITTQFAALVRTTEVVGVTVVSDFRGHVYDLETESSFYIANGVISSNCQCSVAWKVDESELAPGEVF